jgi:hypothetical protein
METVEIGSWVDFEEVWFEPNTKYILTSDINLEGRSINQVSDFYGVLDGNGHTIKNLNSSKDGVAIVKENYGVIKDLVVRNFDVQSEEEVGGICIKNSKQGEIKNCHVSGVFESEKNVGGITSRNRGMIKKCEFSGKLKSEGKIGGITAVNGKNGDIRDSSTSGEIIGGFRTGGIVGENGESIENCSSDATVKNERGTNGALGGLVGRNYASLSDSYFHGGLVKKSEYYKDEEYEMEGLLVGINNAEVINCHCEKSKRESYLIGKNTGFSSKNSSRGSIEDIKQVIITNKI